jgi:alanine-glyoxylate transaminase/serine-glyoxylate transaminase/serine-pyruvate transaminase
MVVPEMRCDPSETVLWPDAAQIPSAEPNLLPIEDPVCLMTAGRYHARFTGSAASEQAAASDRRAPLSAKLLLGPGPSNCAPEVLQALSKPTLGHLDPDFLALMDQVQAALQQLFQTASPLTIPISGTGSAGMETLLVNLLEPGDRVVVAANGVFGGRAADLARRLGAEVVVVEFPWGQPVDPEEVEQALAAASTKALFFVHAETSTGALSDAQTLARLARQHDALSLMDCVTSLAGVPVEVDGWGIDAAFSGTQKCLSVPPGLAPVTLGDRAREVLRSRSSVVPSWYLDLSMVEKYWGPERSYHHTAPIHMIYALAAGLELVHHEGLPRRFQRHARVHQAMQSGLHDRGLRLLPPEGAQLPMLHAVVLPEGCDDAALRTRLLQQHGMEVGAGLGNLKGRVIRVGLMGHNATESNVQKFLAALDESLQSQ